MTIDSIITFRNHSKKKETGENLTRSSKNKIRTDIVYKFHATINFYLLVFLQALTSTMT